MTTTRTTLTALTTALLLTLAAGLSACGDDGSDSSDGEESSSAAPSPDATSEPTSEPTPSESESESEPAEPSASPSAAAVDYCEQVGALNELGELAQGQADDEAFATILDTFASIADAAPPEVADEWDAIGPAFETYIKVIRRDIVDTNNPPAGTTRDEAVEANLATLQRAIKRIEPFDAEIDAIGEHAEEECGLTF